MFAAALSMFSIVFFLAAMVPMGMLFWAMIFSESEARPASAPEISGPAPLVASAAPILASVGLAELEAEMAPEPMADLIKPRRIGAPLNSAKNSAKRVV